MENDKPPEASKELQVLAMQASMEIGRENHEAVLKLADEIEALPEEPGKTIVLSGLWIDAGNALCNESLVTRGIELLEKHRGEYEAQGKSPNDKLTYFYYLGNGYMETAKLKRDADSQYGFFQQEKSDFYEAIEQYRKAVRYASRDINTIQSYVNLGNNLHAQGRCLEALDYYESALSIDPRFGMALGNKGSELKYYAQISGKHVVFVLSEAHHSLDLALKSDTTPQYARGGFESAKQKIEKALGDKLISPPFTQKFKNPGESEVEKNYLDYGLKHGLYLNVCNHCSQRCNQAIEDTFKIETMAVPVSTALDNDPFIRMQNCLNQIKVEYATARYLLFQATQSPYDDSFVLRHVTIMETLDYSLYDLESELLKVSFRSFYSILDQIAWILNEYLRLGIPLDKIYFSNVWYETVGEENNKTKIIRPKILAKKSWALNALYDLNFDMSHSDYHKQLRKMRHSLIHRFIYVRDFQENPTKDEMDKRELELRTIELARFVRNAVAYLMFFLWRDTKAEIDEIKASGKILPQMTLDKREWRGDSRKES